MGVSLPMTYSSLKENEPLPKIVNIVYSDGVISVEYDLTDNKRVQFPNQIYKYKGLPLRSTGQFTLPSGTQKIINTKVAVSIPEEFHAQLESPWTKSRLEPWVAPGIILKGQGEIEILISNLSKIPIKVKKGKPLPSCILYPIMIIKISMRLGILLTWA